MTAALGVATLPVPGLAQRLPFAGYADPAQRISLLVHLPLRNAPEAEALAAQQSTPHAPLYHHWLTRAQFAARYAPRICDVQSAAAFLRAAGASIAGIDAQFIYANARADTIDRLFATHMGLVRDGDVLRPDARVPLTLPQPLIKIGATIIGLTAHSRPNPAHLALAPNSEFPGAYFPGELLQAYGAPAYALGNGAGMKIAIVGGSDSVDADNQRLWCAYGLGPQCAQGATLAPYPTVNHFEASGSVPPHTNGDSLEANLDAQMAGGTAPGATIDQYAAAGDDVTFLKAFSYIVNTGDEDIITTSYTFCPLNFLRDRAPLTALHDVFVQGNLAGQTFLFASGDNGAYGCYYELHNKTPATSIFASDANATGVGGTTELVTVSSSSGGMPPFGTAYAGESSHSATLDEWASGGGVSAFVRAPRFQTWIGISPIGGRQVPDVAMHMGGPGQNQTYDWIVYPPDGAGLVGVIGTSAAAPEFAGSLADAVTAVNASRGLAGGFRLGNVNNFLYYEQAAGNAAKVFHQDIPADNFVTYYNPAPGPGEGYNQVVGLGTPVMPGFVQELGFAATYQGAGDTFTASNP